MSWADHAKDALRRGETVVIRPRGHSMKPRVHDGDAVTLAPVDPNTIVVDDIVLVHVKGRDFLHLVKAVSSEGRFLIGNNRGGINGWVGHNALYGKAIKVGD